VVLFLHLMGLFFDISKCQTRQVPFVLSTQHIQFIVAHMMDVFHAWLNLLGNGDAGDRIVLEDSREVRRLAGLHRREIQNVFGVFELMRAVYGTREGQKIEAVALDERLGLPPCKNSYLLQDGDQALAVQMPFATVSDTLARILGFTQFGAHPGAQPARDGQDGESLLG
jgi:hypothetical protein